MLNERNLTALIDRLGSSAAAYEKSIKTQIEAVLAGESPDFEGALLETKKFQTADEGEEVLENAIGMLPGYDKAAIEQLAKGLIIPLIERAKEHEFAAPPIPHLNKIDARTAVETLAAAGVKLKIVGTAQ